MGDNCTIVLPNPSSIQLYYFHADLVTHHSLSHSISVNLLCTIVIIKDLAVETGLWSHFGPPSYTSSTPLAFPSYLDRLLDRLDLLDLLDRFGSCCFCRLDRFA